MVQVVQHGQRGERYAVPAARVIVRLGGRQVFAGQTDERGRNWAGGLRPGRYALEVTRSGFHPGHGNVEIRGRDVYHEIVLRKTERPPKEGPGPAPDKSARLILQVVERGPRGDRQPVPAARVEVRRGGEHVFSGQTDAAGRNWMGGLSPATYHVRVMREGYQPAELEVAVAGRDVHREVVMQRTGRPPGETPQAQGRLHIQVMGRGDRGTQHALPAADVAIWSGRRPVASGQADRVGRYSSGSLAFGRYIVEARHPGYRPNRVEVTVGRQDVRSEIILSPLPAIE